MDQDDLYAKIAPEYKELDPELPIYRGLKEIGQRSTKAALAAGFVLLRPSGGKMRSGLFLRGEDRPRLEALIERVAQLRQEKQGQQTQREEERLQRRSEKAERLLERLQKKEEDLGEGEEVFAREYCVSAPLRQLTLPRLLEALQRHREMQKKLHQSGPGPDSVPGRLFCSCQGCRQLREEKLEEGRQWLREEQARRQQKQNTFRVLRDYLQEELAEGFALEAEAEVVLGSLWPYAQARSLKKYFKNALQHTADSLAHCKLEQLEEELEQEITAETMPWELCSVEAEDREQLKERFARQLNRRYRQKCVELQRQEKRKKSLEQYVEEEFLPLWEEEAETMRGLAARHEIVIEEILQKEQEKWQRRIESYNGQQSLKKVRRSLEQQLDQLEKRVSQWIAEEEEQQRLVALYGEHSDFASCFPQARALQRELWFFCGPTNSGKTHAALDLLAESASGVYLAPLRLMALEGQEQLLQRGVRASFLTGEERDIVAGAPFVSSTIEMLNYHQVVETAVIDEIQLLVDDDRGWAWTNALVGAPAFRVVLTGSPNALPLVKKIARTLGEPLQVRSFERFNPLEASQSLASLHRDDLQPGTAIVCFSRRDVLELKARIERETSYRVSVIYGALSPDVRREEARRFRQRETEILVATDAISMGLNLPIRTILFWTTTKFYNREEHPLTQSEIKQIAGRAGRYGIEDYGEVSAFARYDLWRIHEALSCELPPLRPPCPVMPLFFHIELLSSLLHTEDLVQILRYFRDRIWFDGELFSPVVTEDMLELARSLRSLVRDLSLESKYLLACAPVDMRALPVLDAYLGFVRHFVANRPVLLPPWGLEKFRRGTAATPEQLRTVEDRVKIVILYQWLAHRFPEEFAQQQRASEWRAILNQYIARSLAQGGMIRRCSICQTPLPPGFPHSFCDDCFLQRRHRKSRSRG